jgi:hypothetical protein
MKKIIYLLILIANFGFGQSGLIELEIKDSVRIKPINFEYNVQISESKYTGYDENGAVGMDSAKIKMLEKYKDLQLFLENKNYKIRPLNNAEFQIYDFAGFWKLGFAVALKTSKELEKLTTELKTLDFITGSVGEIEYGDKELDEKRLFTKILEKAKRKGQMIAGLTGQKLGKIIEFREGKEVDNISVNIKDVYLSSLQNKNWDVVKNILFGQEWKTVVIKFSTE